MTAIADQGAPASKFLDVVAAHRATKTAYLAHYEATSKIAERDGLEAEEPLFLAEIESARVTASPEMNKHFDRVLAGEELSAIEDAALSRFFAQPILTPHDVDSFVNYATELHDAGDEGTVPLMRAFKRLALAHAELLAARSN